MDKSVKISSIQLSVIIIAFVFGEAAILNPATIARQDAWMVSIIGLAGGLVLIGTYTYICVLNPGKTLIEILKDCFGKIMGSIVSVLYLWYIIHLLSLILRSSIEFMNTTIYTETPILFLAIVIMLVVAYATKKGLEVIGRISELLVPLLIGAVFLLFFALISRFDLNNFLPVLENGWNPVLKASFHMTAFPFGETIVLLMVFPHLNKKRNAFKVSFIACIIAGFLLLMITARDLMVLGPDMLARDTNANFISTKFIPGIDIESLIATNMMIGTGIKICVCTYAASMGISQLIKTDNYKPFVMPVSVIGVALAIWIFDSLLVKNNWEADVYPYYAIPFQLVFPLLLLIISLIKKKKKRTSQTYK